MDQTDTSNEVKPSSGCDWIFNLILIAIAIAWAGYLLYTVNPGFIFHPPFDTPVVIHIEQFGPDHSAEINQALVEIDRYVPLATTSGQDADICLIIYDTSGFTGCDTSSGNIPVGCATYFSEETQISANCRGKVLAVAAGKDIHLVNIIIHEILYGLGLFDHSGNPNDIMYPYTTPQTQLSTNDIARLEKIYH